MAGMIIKQVVTDGDLVHCANCGEYFLAPNTTPVETILPWISAITPAVVPADRASSFCRARRPSAPRPSSILHDALRPRRTLIWRSDILAGSPFPRFPEEAHHSERTAHRRDAAHRGFPTSEGPVGAIFVRSACSPIEWSSAVVLSCWGDSHRAIGERTPSPHLICALASLLIFRF